MQAKEGRGCYGRRQGGERWEGFERRWAGGRAEGFEKWRSGFGNKRGREGGGRESFDVWKEKVRRREDEMEERPRGKRRGSSTAAWTKVATAASRKIETYIV